MRAAGGARAGAGGLVLVGARLVVLVVPYWEELGGRCRLGIPAPPHAQTCPARGAGESVGVAPVGAGGGSWGQGGVRGVWASPTSVPSPGGARSGLPHHCLSSAEWGGCAAPPPPPRCPCPLAVPQRWGWQPCQCRGPPRAPRWPLGGPMAVLPGGDPPSPGDTLSEAGADGGEQLPWVWASPAALSPLRGAAIFVTLFLGSPGVEVPPQSLPPASPCPSRGAGATRSPQGLWAGGGDAPGLKWPWGVGAERGQGGWPGGGCLTGRQADRQMDGRVDGHPERQMERQMDRRMEGWGDVSR